MEVGHIHNLPFASTFMQEARKESSLPDDLLLEGAQHYDSKALAEIFDAYYERIFAYIYRRVGSPSQCEDMAGEVFLRLLEALKTDRGPRTNLLAWLYRVAHNMIVDHYRRQSKTATQPLEDWLVSLPDNPTERVEREMLQEQIRLAVSRLTQDQQQVIVLKFVEELTNAQVGMVMGKPEGAIKSLQHRALAALRRQMEDGQLNLSASAFRRALE
jgi:RNA polymerase sigma-70 factor (ECF subfamily)